MQVFFFLVSQEMICPFSFTDSFFGTNVSHYMFAYSSGNRPRNVVVCISVR